jgi:superfamily II DNA or RNA helicase
LGTLHGIALNEDGERERFVIAEPQDLEQSIIFAKERRLVDEVKAELGRGRKVHIFAVYTQKRDVTARLQELLRNEGIRTEVLRAEVPPEQREAWYESELRNGMQVCIAHPKLCSVGLDLLEFPVLLFDEGQGDSHLHLAPSQSEKLADWSEAPGQSGISDLC